MKLKHLKKSWDSLAKQDAMWAVLTWDEKAGGQWDAAAFLETGRKDVENILDRLAYWKVPVNRGHALDFGCGLGRLTAALASHFETADGVDISEEMVARARVLHSGQPNLRFLQNSAPDLSLLTAESYDFLLSLISLQHMEEAHALEYIRDMPRVLRKGGVAYLQIATHLDPSDAGARAKLDRDASVVNRAYRRIRQWILPTRHRMQTFYCRLSRVLAALEQARVRVIAVFPDQSLPAPYVSHVLVFQRPR